jgi:dTDP-4-amino-4,6-dideoxygalactose transaminase
VVPLVDLTRRNRRLERAFVEAAERILRSGTVLLGPELDALETELDAVLHAGAPPGRNAVVGVASGASALQLTFAALGIGPGDEVVVPAFTAVPTASAVAAVGARPVPVDVDPATAALDRDATGAALTPRTKAIVIVHLYGRPADVTPFLALGVPVIEDAAQAHGALADVTGTAAAYSFYPTKNMGGVGDGGAVVTPDRDLAATVRRLRTHGMAEQYVHVDISQNHRLSELEAAWLRLQLPHLGAANARRAEIAARYEAAAPGLRWHAGHPDHVIHQCVARVPDRDIVRERLAASGVATGVHYPLAITQQPAYRSFTAAPCPESEAWAAECLSLPCFPELTDEEVGVVAAALEALEA